MDLNAFVAKALARPTPFVEHGRDYDGWDCWGCVLCAYRDVLGIELPSYSREDYRRALPGTRLAELVDRERRAMWRAVPEPAPGDVVVLKIKRYPVHCGVVLGGGQMIHAHHGTDTTVERYGGLIWRDRLDDYWRHESRA